MTTIYEHIDGEPCNSGPERYDDALCAEHGRLIRRYDAVYEARLVLADLEDWVNSEDRPSGYVDMAAMLGRCMASLRAVLAVVDQPIVDQP